MSLGERSGRSATPAVALDAVVTHHLDAYRSGVAVFNEVLAGRLGVPVLSLGGLEHVAPAHPLLSFKARELDPDSAAAVEAWLDAKARSWDVFLHEYLDLPLERRLVEGARRVLCGNEEIEQRVRPLSDDVEVLWAPGSILDDRVFRPSEISVFSFGMAHKIRVDMFERLKALLDASGRSYAVYVSAANHETASLRDSAAVFEEMHALFPDALYFLGNLSDVAVSAELRRATFFAAFFAGGVRANNSSVSSAMERGAVTITNLDGFSPREYVHMENVIDIERCSELPSDPLVLRRIGVAAMETARGRTWDRLVERIVS